VICFKIEADDFLLHLMIAVLFSLLTLYNYFRNCPLLGLKHNLSVKFEQFGLVSNTGAMLLVAFTRLMILIVVLFVDSMNDNLPILM